MMTSPNSYSGQGHSSSHHSQQQQQQQQHQQHQYQLSWDREVHSMIETVAKGEIDNDATGIYFHLLRSVSHIALDILI
jgi:hypothetical protein